MTGDDRRRGRQGIDQNLGVGGADRGVTRYTDRAHLFILTIRPAQHRRESGTVLQRGVGLHIEGFGDLF